MIVVDSSVILANVFREPGGDSVLDRLSDAAMLSVNVTEVISKLTENGWDFDDAVAAFQTFGLAVFDFGIDLAIDAARLHAPTLHRGLSLGDRACLALARREKATALTADRKWADLNLGCQIELVR
ncbi:MAG: type II toxin-antitoxin system VapC family toxin [Phyllobacteriaceae bacterium]|nr:type II toxin-antitoxin system VapC family toxin [Phyllobacteriaceae bacterium]